MNTELADSRREAILDSAMALFASQGYASTTIDEVAAAAGISKGSVYNYFKSKHDLFTQLFNQAVFKDEANVGALMAEPLGAGEKLCMILDYWHEGFGADLKIGRLTLEFWATAAHESQTGMLAENIHAAYDRWLAQIERIIRQGIDSGEMNPQIDPKTHATLFLGLIDGLMLHAILGIGSTVDDKFMASMKQSVLGSLGIRQMPNDRRKQ